MPHKWNPALDYDDDDFDDDYYDDGGDDDDDHHHHHNRSTSTSLSVRTGHSQATQQSAAAAPAEELPETNEGFWSCPVCTFDNSLESPTCDICDTPRTEEASEGVSETFTPGFQEKADDVHKVQRVSPFAKALFKSPPGTKSNKQMTPAAVLPSDYQITWDKASDKIPSISSKLVPFKFDTPSPDEKNIVARGLKKPPIRVARNLDDISTGTRTKAKADNTAVRNSSVLGSATGASTSSTQVHDIVSVEPNKLAEKLQDLSIESYVPEPWMLQESSKDSRQLLHLIVVGHVDSGKSTLMGRILHLLGRITQKEMHKNEKESKQQGKGSFAYAFVLDEGAEERARGVTMTVAVAHLETAKLRVVLLDAPGHKDFVPNMISGASQADAAILVVDASPGGFEAGLQGGGQTKEHAQLVRSLGVEQLIVAVNKLDAVEFSKDRFDSIKSTLEPYLKQCGFKDGSVQWVPVSAATGQNLTTSTSEPALKAWYDGPCLVEMVDSLEPPRRLVAKPLRLVVAEVMRTPTLGPSAFAGKLESGAIQVGTKVRVMPSGEIATVKRIEQQGHHLAVARAGDGVDVGLQGIDPTWLAPGCVVCHPDYPVPVATRFEIRLLTLDIKTPILKGSQVDLHVHHSRQPARVDALVSLIDPKKGTVLRQRPRHLTANQSAIVEIVPEEGLCIEKYTDFRALGRVALRQGGKTVAVGIVTSVMDRK